MARIFDGEVVTGVVDGSTHYRDCVHPRQADWYRGDKHRHFILAQVVSMLCGLFTQVDLFQGLNNDQGTAINIDLYFLLKKD